MFNNSLKQQNNFVCPQGKNQEIFSLKTNQYPESDVYEFQVFDIYPENTLDRLAFNWHLNEDLESKDIRVRIDQVRKAFDLIFDYHYWNLLSQYTGVHWVEIKKKLSEHNGNIQFVRYLNSLDCTRDKIEQIIETAKDYTIEDVNISLENMTCSQEKYFDIEEILLYLNQLFFSEDIVTPDVKNRWKNFLLNFQRESNDEIDEGLIQSLPILLSVSFLLLNASR